MNRVRHRKTYHAPKLQVFGSWKQLIQQETQGGKVPPPGQQLQGIVYDAF